MEWSDFFYLVKKMKRLRVGIIGLGEQWERHYAPALRATQDRFEIRAVCDQIGERAARVAQEFGVSTSSSFRLLAQREDIDAILILAPQWYAELAILAAYENMKPVYFGQLPHDQSRTRRLLESAAKAGIPCMAELKRRHAPATIRLKELIATRLGPPRLLFCRYDQFHQAETGREYNDTNKKQSEMVEMVDWCRYIVGRDPTTVTGFFHYNEYTSETVSRLTQKDDVIGASDYGVITLDFSVHLQGIKKIGPSAQIELGVYISNDWNEAMTYRAPTVLKAVCRDGIAMIDPPYNLVWFDSAGRHQESLEADRPVDEQLLIQFHHLTTGTCRGSCDLTDAFQALRIVDLAKISHETGRRIRLTETPESAEMEAENSADIRTIPSEKYSKETAEESKNETEKDAANKTLESQPRSIQQSKKRGGRENLDGPMIY